MSSLNEANLKHAAPEDPSLSEGRAAKRTRSQAAEGGGAIPEPHPELSFDDGNIVLVAGNTSFRVHKSQLARKSPVFKHWFATKDFEKTADGCDVMHVENSAKDLGVFLDAVYNGPR